MPPAELVQECPVPGAGGVQTNADLLGYIRALKAALRGCNDDKEALRFWMGSAAKE